MNRTKATPDYSHTVVPFVNALDPDLLIRERGRKLLAEERLMLAVLEDALYDVKKNRALRHREPWAARMYDDAWQYLFAPDDGSQWPFSCCHICEQLGLDRSALHAALRRLVALPTLVTHD